MPYNHLICLSLLRSPPALSRASETGEILSVQKLVHKLHQLPRAGLALALNLPSVFPLVSLRFGHAAAFELQTAAVYTPTKPSSVYVLTTLLDQAKEHGASVELIHLFSTLAHSRVTQESFAVLE